MRLVVAACVVGAMVGADRANAQTAASAKRPAARSGWTLTKQVDKMTDAEALTLVLRSQDGLASLRVHCNESGKYVVFLTFPKAIRVTDPTLAEVRFDKKEPIGYMMMAITHDLLVTGLGGSKTDANYTFATTDPAKGVKGEFTADDVAAGAASLIKEIQGSTRMVYRLSLAQPATGTEGTFTLGGFSRAVAPLTKQCPIQ